MSTAKNISNQGSLYHMISPPAIAIAEPRSLSIAPKPFEYGSGAPTPRITAIFSACTAPCVFSTSAWEGFKFRWLGAIPNCLRLPLQALLAKSDNFSEDDLTKVVGALEYVVLEKCTFRHPAAHMIKQVLSKLAPQDLSACLTKLAIRSSSSDPRLHALPALALQLLSLEILQKTAGTQGSKVDLSPSSLSALERRCFPAHLDLRPLKSSWGSKIAHFISDIIEFFMRLSTLFNPNNRLPTIWEASYLITILIQTVLLPPYAVYQLASQFYTPLNAAAITGTFVLSVAAALTAYLKWARPVPRSLPFCENWTYMAQTGKLTPPLPDAKEVSDVLSTFGTLSEGMTLNPLLLGPSGVGKTEIMKAVAFKIAEGAVPKYLQGKQLFSINTTALGNGAEAAKNLEEILKLVRGFEDQIIFFFDEAHNAVGTGSKQHALAEILKPLLDRGGIHCAAATTTQEYAAIQGNPGFKRRFRLIDVKAPAEGTIKAILLDRIVRYASDILFAPTALDDLISISHKTGEAFSQPDKAITLLTEAVNKVRTAKHAAYVFPALQRKKAQLSALQSKFSMDSAHALNPATQLGKEYSAAFERQEKEVAHWEGVQRESHTDAQLIQNAITQHFRIKKAWQRNLHALTRGDSSPNQSDSKQYLFDLVYRMPVVEDMLLSAVNQLHPVIPLRIDAALLKSL